MENSIVCSYCGKNLNPDMFISTDIGPACDDCALRPDEIGPTSQNAQTESQEEAQQETQATDTNQTQDPPVDLGQAYKELTWVRMKQSKNGETDAVIMKRPLLEVILLMEEELKKAKEAAIALHPQGLLIARFHALSATCLGLAYASTHPAG